MTSSVKRLLIKWLFLPLNEEHGPNSGEGGVVRGGEVSMERSKEVGGVRITTR